MSRGRLLVARVDDGDALVETAVVDRQDMAAAEREHVADPGLLQGAGDQLSTRQIGHVTTRRTLA